MNGTHEESGKDTTPVVGPVPGGTPSPGASLPPLLQTERLPAPSPAPARPPGRVRRIGTRGLAWTVAASADALQWGLLPLFAPGFASPFNWVLDLVVGGILIKLLGWHWAFLPSFAAELIPGVDLVPTWTMAVFVATAIGKKKPVAR